MFDSTVFLEDNPALNIVALLVEIYLAKKITYTKYFFTKIRKLLSFVIVKILKQLNQISIIREWFDKL